MGLINWLLGKTPEYKNSVDAVKQHNVHVHGWTRYNEYSLVSIDGVICQHGAMYLFSSDVRKVVIAHIHANYGYVVGQCSATGSIIESIFTSRCERELHIGGVIYKFTFDKQGINNDIR